MRGYLFLSIALSLFLAGCGPQEKPSQPAPTDVTAFMIQQQTIPANFEFVGVAKSSHPVEIRSRVEGYLMSVDYLEGSQVEPGQLLFRIDPSQFIAQVEEAKGELEKQEAILWRAKQNLQRIQPLYEKNASSQRDLDNAIAQVLAAEANVISAKGNLEVAELNLSYTYITSPIKGMSSRALYYQGTLITPSVNGLLTEVSVLDPIWVYFSISDNEILQAQSLHKEEELILPKEPEYTVKLTLANGAEFPYEGKVNFSAPILDPKTGTLMVRAVFPNPQSTLRPGEFVRANVYGALRPNAIFVPKESVFQGRKGMYVFVIGSDNKVSARDVVVGAWYKDYWVIEKGLENGEVVVKDGVNKLQEGSEVRITKLYHPELLYSEEKGG